MAREEFNSYWRGILQRNHPRLRPAGYIQEGLNIAMVGGRPRSRPGLRPYCGASCAGNVRGMGFHVTPAGYRELLVCAGSTIQRIPPYGDPITVPTAFPSTWVPRVEPTRAHFVSLSGGGNVTFIYDGVNPNIKYDGTQLTKMGIEPGPKPAVPTISSSGGKITHGTRSYVITLDSGYHEGPESITPRVVVFPGGSTQKATFASPTDGVDYDDPQVTTWKLYRTVDGGQDYFFVDAADIGVNIVDTLSDTDLSARTPLEEFVNPEPADKFVALTEHRGQLAGVYENDRNLLKFSYLDDQYMVPEGWPLDWEKPVAHGDGDEIVALISFHDWLLVFKTNSAWGLGGTWPEMDPVPIFAAGGSQRQGLGCIAPGAILNLENRVIFASRDGFYMITRALNAGATIDAQRLSGPIDDLYAAANFAYGSSCSFDRKKRLFVFWGHG